MPSESERRAGSGFKEQFLHRGHRGTQRETMRLRLRGGPMRIQLSAISIKTAV